MCSNFDIYLHRTSGLLNCLKPLHHPVLRSLPVFHPCFCSLPSLQYGETAVWFPCNLSVLLVGWRELDNVSDTHPLKETARLRHREGSDVEAGFVGHGEPQGPAHSLCASQRQFVGTVRPGPVTGDFSEALSVHGSSAQHRTEEIVAGQTAPQL